MYSHLAVLNPLYGGVGPYGGGVGFQPEYSITKLEKDGLVQKPRKIPKTTLMSIELTREGLETNKFLVL